MPSKRNDGIVARFDARVADYDRHAELQHVVAARLAEYLPRHGVSSVLEVGCGTGLLTRHLLSHYPGARFTITDVAPGMVSRCRETLGTTGGGDIHFSVMDGERPDLAGPFDLIVLSMTAQWFREPAKALDVLSSMLTSGGTVHYATLAPGGFPQWRESLAALGLADGFIDMPELQGVHHVETLDIDYGSALGFLSALKGIGATAPRPGYKPQSPGAIRRALRHMQAKHGGRMTWRIAYGQIPAHRGNVS